MANKKVMERITGEAKFNKTYGDLPADKVQLEILKNQLIQNDLLDRNRRNTSNLVWFLIVVPIISWIIAWILF